MVRFVFANPAVQTLPPVNGPIEETPKTEVLHLLEPKTILYYDFFYQCRHCRQVYWKGTHFDQLKEKIANLGLLLIFEFK